MILLKEIWIEYRDGNGQRYYHNRLSNRLVWELPVSMTSSNEVWVACRDQQERRFYYNRMLNESVWEIPEPWFSQKEHTVLNGLMSKYKQRGHGLAPVMSL